MIARQENCLFAGSDVGGERAAMMYSLINKAILNGVEPETYLTYVLSVIAVHPVNRVGCPNSTLAGYKIQ